MLSPCDESDCRDYAGIVLEASEQWGRPDCFHKSEVCDVYQAFYVETLSLKSSICVFVIGVQFNDAIQECFSVKFSMSTVNPLKLETILFRKVLSVRMTGN